MKKGLALAALQVMLALSVAAKFAYDRETLPRVWVNATPVDPNLPLRGRYVQLGLRVELEGANANTYTQVKLSVQNERLVGRVVSSEEGHPVFSRGAGGPFVLSERVAFFLPPRVSDPSRRPPGEELWVEVSVPENGLPRPIRLGVKKDGVLTPLDLR
jgi:hypothetical protein